MSAENRRYSLWVAVVLALICMGIGVGISYWIWEIQSSDNPTQAEPNAIVQPQPEIQNNTTENTDNTIVSIVPDADQKSKPSSKKPSKKNKHHIAPLEPRPKDSNIELPF